MNNPTKIKVRAGNSVYEVEYIQGGDIINIKIDDQEYKVNSSSAYKGFYSLLIDDRSIETLISGKDNRFNVGYESHEFEVEFFDPRARKPASETGKPVAEGKQKIKAPMAGRIVSTLVNKGDEVEEGDGLIVLEAMKMENKLASHGAGIVLDILVSENDTVNSGQDLMIIDMG
jgi:biotin carboxyl carrier protein